MKKIAISFILASVSGTAYASPMQDSLRADSLKTDTLKEVTITTTRLLFVTRKDTTIYDLDALNLKSSALLRDAFEKLPGMTFRNGVLYHNGREVKRVLVNGMDFNSNNPMQALQVLPSYIMKDVKVYEKKSDFATRYDVDDGREELVADVSVRRKYMGTWTGEVAAGGGTGGRFMGKAFGNTFTDRFRVSLFGNANNINEQMWYNGDGKERAGEAKTGDNQFYIPGGTFFWKNKKAMKEKGYFYIEGGADYNNELYDEGEKRTSELYLSDGTMYSAFDSHTKTNTDRGGGHLKMDWNIADKLALYYLGSFDVKRLDSDGSALKANWNENPLPNGGSITDTLEHLLTADSRKPGVVDLQQQEQSMDKNRANYNHILRLTYATKERTYFTLVNTMNFTDTDSKEHNNTFYKFFNEEAHRSYRLNRLLDKNGREHSQKINANIIQYFYVKGFRIFRADLRYTYLWQQSNSDERGWLGEHTGTSETLDNETTRDWRAKGYTHDIEPSLSLAKGICSFQLTPRLTFRHDEIDYSKRDLPTQSPQKDYRLFRLHTSFRFRSEKTGTLFAQYNLAPTVPDIRSFVTYPDKADPQYIILGNDQLKAGHGHWLTAWYSRNFTHESEKGKVVRTLSAHIAYTRKNNDLTNHTTYDRTTGVVTTKPVNVSGNRDAKANIGFTTPLDVNQRFWLELFTEASMLRTQTYSGVVTADNTEQQFNDNRLRTYTASVKPRMKLSSVDLSLAYELTVENNRGTYVSVNDKAQWQHLLTGKLDWQLPWHLAFNATLNYHNYAGYLSGKRENWVMMDLGIERAFLKNENLFVRISGHDLFNQNNGFLREYSATALTHTYRKTLGRYGMLTLKWRFASKKK